MKRALSLSIVLSLTSLISEAQIPTVDEYQAGSQQMAYPVPERYQPKLSQSPDGYVPFHMEHYGRHGSRWLLNTNDYDKPVQYLQKAKEAGVLTPRGEEVLEELMVIQQDSKGRLGELTPLGHRQHRGIARRMVENFPEIFTDSTYLDAKSTMVIRCILSMANEMAEMQMLRPGMKIKMDASATTQKTLAYNSEDTVARRLSREARHYSEDYAASLPKPDAFYDKLFTDRAFLNDSLDAQDVFDRVFYIAVNMQSHDDYPSIYDLFTQEELMNGWLARNADWYISSGMTPLTENRVPYNQRYLLKNIIESADTAMMSPNISANLRFGHESILLPLSVLMGINNAGYQTEDLTSLAEHWRNYEIFPMASNIQIVFYKPENKSEYSLDDVLIKVLLNEQEATLPLKPVTGNYYRWTDLRKRSMENIEKYME